MELDVDLLVIGGGSGGVRCARIAAQLGARVAIVEENRWGGTCVNVGCVPKKLMVQAGDYRAAIEDAAAFGWSTTAPTHDWGAFMATKNREIERLNGIYVDMLERAGATVIEGHATFRDARTVEVGDRRITARHIVIATGGRPDPAGIEGASHAIVSDDAFFLRERPARVAVLGSGYIGVEFAGIFEAFGSEVHLVYRKDKPLHGFDEDLRDGLVASAGARGIHLHPGRTIEQIEAASGSDSSGKTVVLSDGRRLEVDLVLLATGRVPHVAGLGLERAGVAVDAQGSIEVDAHGATSVAGIHAIGDVCNRLNLTPVAIAEGHHLAERLFGQGTPRSWDLAHVAKAVFFSPAIASVGITEAEAGAQGPTDIYLSKFRSLRHAITGRAANASIIKLVVDHRTGVLLGAHMMGEEAPDIIQGFAIAVSAGLTKTDVDRTVGIHPTAAEELVTMRAVTRTVGSEPSRSPREMADEDAD